MSLSKSENLIKYRALINVLLLLCHLNAVGLQVDTGSTLNSKIENIVSPLTEKYPGFSVTVTKSQSILYSKGFGYRDLAESKPFTDSTLFYLYSVAKTFTGVALAKLVEDKQININASILLYDQSLPKSYEEITPRLLASHMGGIRNYSGDWLDFASHSCKNTQEAIQQFVNDSLVARPGTKANYSTYGFVLLSHVVSKASKQRDYYQYMKTAVFDKSNMTDTYLDGDVPNLNRISKAYYINPQNDSLIIIDGIFNSCKFGGGGFVTTTKDMGKFAIALLNENILKGKSLKQFYSPFADPMVGIIKKPDVATDGYGMGVEYHQMKINDKESTFYISHGGSSPGGRSYILMFPKEKISVSIGGNLNGEDFGEYAKSIASQVLKSHY